MSEHPWSVVWAISSSFGRRFVRTCEACGAVVASPHVALHEKVCPGVCRG